MTAGRTTASSSQSWCTPPKYVNVIRHFFGGVIDLDPCSNPQSIVNAQVSYQLPKQDGLHLDWTFHKIFVNPPYGADRERKTTIKNWLFKCNQAHLDHGSEVLALVPVATNTAHWKHYVWGAANAVCFLYDTRLKFLVDGQDEGKGAPMSCAMIYWGGRVAEFDRAFCGFGAIVDVTPLKGRFFGSHQKHREQPTLFVVHEERSNTALQWDAPTAP
ncbi:MAG: DNA N-6-adenine-methyltransferase [Terrimicrobiaceae bacterium]